MKNIFKFTCLGLLLATMGAGIAHAQNKTARGMISNAAQQSACVDELVNINDRLQQLDNFAGRLETCNRQGQTFDGTDCVDLAGITHRWEFNASGKPTNLILYSNGEQVDNMPIEVFVGDPGLNRSSTECPEGYKPR